MSLRETAQRCDDTIAAARAELVDAIRHAHRAGMTQAEIAREVGRSQPEVNRLLRFHGTSPRAQALRRHSAEIRQHLRDIGGTHVRVFGSTASGSDGPDSDVDLVFEMTQPLSLMELSVVESQLSELLGATVDLVPESSLRADVRDQVLREAVPL